MTGLHRIRPLGMQALSCQRGVAKEKKDNSSRPLRENPPQQRLQHIYPAVLD